MTYIKKANGHKEKLNSFLVACLIDSNLIVNAISMIAQIDNLFPIFCITIGAVFIINNFSNLRISRRTILFSVLFGIQALSGYILLNNVSSRQYLLCFISVGIPALIISGSGVKIESICKTVLWINIFTLFYAINLLKMEAYSLNSGAQMGVSYSYLPLFLFSVLLLIEGKKNALDFFLSIMGVVVSVGIIISQMTRGTILCIIIFALSEFWILYRKSHIKVIILMLIFMGIGFYLLFIRRYLINTEWYYYMFVLKSDDIFNGRLSLFKVVWQSNDLFGAIFGNGVGSYQNAINSDAVVYPHNLILQLFYEQGVFVALYYVYVIVRSVMYFLNLKCINNNRQYVLILFCCAIVKLMVSDYFWISPIFWLYSGYIISRRYLENEVFVCNIH